MKLMLCTLLALITAVTGADSKPYKGKVHEIPGKIEAEHYDEGNPGVAYHDLDKKNHGANYRGPTQVDIEKTTGRFQWSRTGLDTGRRVAELHCGSPANRHLQPGNPSGLKQERRRLSPCH